MDLELVREVWEMQGSAPEGAAEARAQVQRAVSLVAAAGRALLGEAGSQLEWLPDARAFATPPVAGKLRIGLAPAKLELRVTDAAGKTAASLALDGKTAAEAAKWIGEQAGQRGSAVSIDAGAPFTFAASEALEDLARSYGNAYRALVCVAAMVESDQPVRLAPDGLHLTCGVSFGGGNAVGIGYCDGDTEIATAYYYAKPCPLPAGVEVGSLPELEGGGEWKTEGSWFGGILPRPEWIWYDAEQLQAGAVVSFLDSAVDAARDLFRG